MGKTASKSLEMANKTEEPPNWLDLPDHIWTRVMKLLPWSDLKRMHLVCKRLDEVASNFIPHKLVFEISCDKNFTGNHFPARYFDEICVMNSNVLESEEEIQQTGVMETIGVRVKRMSNNAVLKCYGYAPPHIQRMTKTIREIGVHVKKLMTAKESHTTSGETFLKLLQLLPNLTFLDIKNLILNDEPAVGKVKLPKLKILKLNTCPGIYSFSLEDHNHSLEKIVLNNVEDFDLKELELFTDDISKLVPLLKSQEKTLKKLKIYTFRNQEELLEFFESMQDLRLEYLGLQVFGLNISSQKFLNFLGRQRASLKTLTLTGSKICNKTINYICESLPNLETLEFMFRSLSSESLATEHTNNLCKLKKICFYFEDPNCNFLNGLGLAVNENLQILEVKNFQLIPATFISTLPAFIPNLRSVKFLEYPCEFIDLLKLFENLEHLELRLTCSSENHLHKLVPMNDVVAKNLKHLNIWSDLVMDPPTATKIARDYPNLESIQISRCWQLSEECVEILLKNLKELRNYQIFQSDFTLSKEILTHIKNYGKNLTKFTVKKVDFGPETVREILNDFDNFKFIAYPLNYYCGLEVKF